MLKTNWDSGHPIVDMSQIDAIRSFTILKEEKVIDPIVEAASDFLNMTNPHMISEVFETHVLNLDRWKTKVGFQNVARSKMDGTYEKKCTSRPFNYSP